MLFSNFPMYHAYKIFMFSHRILASPKAALENYLQENEPYK